jgi:hypothetical protein
MAYGKINTLFVYGPKDVEIYKVGQKRAEEGEPREIAEIRDIGMEFPDSITVGYDLLDKKGDLIARFEGGVYATWFDDPKKAEG